MNRKSVTCCLLGILWAGTVVLRAMQPQSDPSPAPAKTAPDNPFDQALSRAKTERKYLVVVVLDKDCPDCDRLAAETLKDADVAKWLEQRAVVLQLSRAESVGENFATSHAVNDFPAVLVFAGDGLELGRQAGYFTPSRFLIKMNAVIESDAIRGEGGLRNWAGEDVVLGAIDRAASLTAEGKHEEALKEYVWCFEHRAAHSPLFVAMNLHRLVAGLADLAQKHGPAKQELLDRLAAAEQETLTKERADTFGLYLIKHGYLALGDEAKIVSHYDRMKARFPKGAGAPAFARLIFEPLLHARRYEDLRPAVDAPEHVDVYLDESRKLRRPPEEVRRLLGTRYEVLLGLGDHEEAETVASKLMGYDQNSPKSLTALAAAAMRSGRAGDPHVAMARKAYLATDGKDLLTVQTLAMLLGQRNPRDDEAQNLLVNAIKAATNEPERKVLGDCLRDIQAGRIPQLYKPELRPGTTK